jgi:hypothetical protein
MMESNHSSREQRSYDWTGMHIEPVVSVGGANSEITSPLADLSEPVVRRMAIEQFTPYTAAAVSLHDLLSAAEDPVSIGGYIDSGTEMDVVRIDSDNVMKLPQPTIEEVTGLTPTQAVAGRVDALVKGWGLPGLEQIVAYSDRVPLAIVVAYAPGTTMKRITAHQKNLIRDVDYVRLCNTLEAMHDRGLAIDAARGNLIYDPQSGFTVIDYDVNSGNWQSIEAKVLGCLQAEVLLCDVHRRSVVPDYALRFRDICAKRYGSGIIDCIHTSWDAEQLIVP